MVVAMPTVVVEDDNGAVEGSGYGNSGSEATLEEADGAMNGFGFGYSGNNDNGGHGRW